MEYHLPTIVYYTGAQADVAAFAFFGRLVTKS